METTQQTGMLAVTQRRGEMAVSAMAAKAKAEVEAKYTIALHRPRNIDEARINILECCKRPGFAKGAIYKKPVGGQTIDGFSIRFAEAAIQAMKNISVDNAMIWEDSEWRTVHISVTDLESNTSYGKDITIAKTVERRFLKDGQVAISERLNSKGEKTFLVAATEDEIANKVASAESKIIRNNGLRLIPQDILDEAWEAIEKTMEGGGGDAQQEKKKICDAFAAINIKPSELEKYLGHPVDTVSPKELRDLRAIYQTIKDGEASWSSYMDEARTRSMQPGKPQKPEKMAKATTTAAAETPAPALIPEEDNVPMGDVKPEPENPKKAAATTPAAPTARIITPDEVPDDDYVAFLRGLLLQHSIDETAFCAWFSNQWKLAKGLDTIDKLYEVTPGRVTDQTKKFYHILPDIKKSIAAQ
jgi:hypothetical protein